VQNHLDIQGPAMEGGATILPGSRGEHALQSRFKTRGRAYAFYDRQLLDHLNPLMREFIGQQEMMFIATADASGECDCSFRAGPPGFVRVLNERQLMYPEYRGNGVMASLGNMVDNPHIGLFFADFFGSTVGLHVNGTGAMVELEDLERTLGPADAAQCRQQSTRRRCERWVMVTVEEAYIHCSKHIPALAKRDKKRHWGTDDPVLKAGDYFQAPADCEPQPRRWLRRREAKTPTAGH
jgi:predicted pyridoxine 5'-phosphate oxidase superfamily flavin-nucleotide-binding protein